MLAPYMPMLVPPRKWKGYEFSGICHPSVIVMIAFMNFLLPLVIN